MSSKSGVVLIDEFILVDLPELIAFVREVFHADPDGILKVFDHVRRPVVENLETSEFDFPFLDVDPGVRDDVGDGLDLGLVLKEEFLNQ